MDMNSIRDQVSNMTMYDVKAGVRKVQNAMMNYTEMESKVREATNNEPWGASSSLMQEIANGTHSYQLLNEIMPMIYKRFTEKAAEEWRQIYKGLQLLEFLIKNGSERVVDDARSHMSLLRMLRQFHYIDQNGKDQGINIRNRSQELTKLLGDVEAIRQERKKAKANRNKFGGFEGGIGTGMRAGGFSGGYAGGSGFGSGGFGNEHGSFGGFSGGVYGDGGGFGGSTPGEFQDTGRRTNRFEEYDENEDDDGYPTRRRTGPTPPTATKPEPKKPAAKAPEPDLVSFDDDDAAAAPAISAPSNTTASGKQPAGNGLANLTADDDDDFDDFQSASPTTKASAPQSQLSSIPPPTMATASSTQTQFAAPTPVSGTQGADLNGLVGMRSIPPTPSTASNFSAPSSQAASVNLQSPALPSQPPKPTGFQAVQPNYFTSVPAPQSQQSGPKSPTAPSTTGSKPAKPSGDAFDSLWSSASASAGIKSTASAQPKGPNLASMAKEKSSAGIWGSPAPGTGNSQQSQQKSGNTGGSASNDLLG